MASMLAVALTSISIFLPKVKSVADAGRSVQAVYAADTAVEVCLYESRNAVAAPAGWPLLTTGATYTVASLSATPLDLTGNCRPLGSNGFRIRAVGSQNDVSRSLEVSQ